MYFPPSVEIEYQPTPSTSSLRELRLSHVHSRPSQFANLFTSVGSGLRTLSLHHVSYDSRSALSHCSSLLRLELGVAGSHYTPELGQPTDLVKQISLSLNLHLLRVHLVSGVQLKRLVEALKKDKTILAGLKTLDITGLFPENSPRSWSGKLVEGLMNECQERDVVFCFNGVGIHGLAGFWEAVVGVYHGIV